MLPKKTFKLAIVEDNVYQNKILTKYVSTICNTNSYEKFEFDIKSFTSAQEVISTLQKDLDLIILDYEMHDPKNSEDTSAKNVLKQVAEQCTQCKVILLGTEREKQKIPTQNIYQFVDKYKSDNNRIGALIQEILQEQSAL